MDEPPSINEDDLAHPDTYYTPSGMCIHHSDLLGHVMYQGRKSEELILSSLAEKKHESPYCNVEDEHGWKAIHFAAANNDLVLLRALIEEGECDPHSQSSAGVTPLNAALSRKSKQTVKYLNRYFAKERSQAMRQSFVQAGREFERSKQQTLKDVRACVPTKSTPGGDLVLRAYRKRRPRYNKDGNRLRSKASIEAEKRYIARLKAEAEERARLKAEHERLLRGRLKLSTVCKKSLFEDFYERNWTEQRKKGAQGRKEMLQWIGDNKWEQYLKTW